MTSHNDTIALLPDLDDYVHGIVALNPVTVQCDGCGKLHEHDGSLAIGILSSGILFDPKRYSLPEADPRHDARRLCATCRATYWAD